MIKKNKKGVSVIIAFVIVTSIILFSVLFAYRWGIPIIQTNKQTIELREVTSKFPELKSKVDIVAMEGNLSSRKIDFRIKDGALTVDANKDLIRYKLVMDNRFCDLPTSINITLANSTNVPSQITSLSGAVFKLNYSFDNDTRHVIIADTDNRREYDDLYLSSVQNSTCFERYTFKDMFVTEKNKFGIFFSRVKKKTNAMDAIFTPTAKKEDNLYHLCGSGFSITNYEIYLKYSNPTYVGTCDDVEHFNELNITSSAYCREPCSLLITNNDGKIEVKKV